MGGISHNGKTQLVTVNGTLNIQKYRDDILAPVVLPFMQAGNGVTILQQDNARPHTARATTQFLAANSVNVMEWPSMSLDRSPIEHMTDVCVLALISLQTFHSFRRHCFKSVTIYQTTSFVGISDP